MRISVLRLLLSFHSVTGFPKFTGIFSAAFKTSSSSENDWKDDSSGQTPSSSKDAPCKESSESWKDGMEFEEYDHTVAKDKGTSVLNEFQLTPLLQIPVSCSFLGATAVTPIRSFCDTAATRSVMSLEAVERLGLGAHLDRSYAGEAVGGLASGRVLGRLPAGLMNLHLNGQTTVPSPTLLIIEESSTSPSSAHSVELMLGLDFLREYGAILDLRDEELRILVGAEEYSIPFLRPRSSLPSLY